MSTDDLVFLKQIVDNAEYANETGVLNIIRLFKHPNPDVSRGTSYASGAFDTLQRLLVLRPDLLTPAVIRELEVLADDQDQQLRSAAKAALESVAHTEAAGTGAPQPDLAAGVPGRTKPASPRTGVMPTDLAPGDLASYLKEHFAHSEWPYNFFLTPGELCDVVDVYLDRLIVRWSDKDERLSAQTVYVGLRWKEHPDTWPISLVGLWAFPTPEQAKHVWVTEGVYPASVPVETVLDIRGRFALNFREGSYFVDAADVEEIDPQELWPRIWKHCQTVGIPIEP